MESTPLHNLYQVSLHKNIRKLQLLEELPPLSFIISSSPGRGDVIMMRREKTERKKLKGQEGWREIGSRTVIDQGGREFCEICIQEGKGQ